MFPYATYNPSVPPSPPSKVSTALFSVTINNIFNYEKISPFKNFNHLLFYLKSSKNLRCTIIFLSNFPDLINIE